MKAIYQTSQNGTFSAGSNEETPRIIAEFEQFLEVEQNENDFQLNNDGWSDDNDDSDQDEEIPKAPLTEWEKQLLMELELIGSSSDSAHEVSVSECKDNQDYVSKLSEESVQSSEKKILESSVHTSPFPPFVAPIGDFEIIELGYGFKGYNAHPKRDFFRIKIADKWREAYSNIDVYYCPYQYLPKKPPNGLPQEEWVKLGHFYLDLDDADDPANAQKECNSIVDFFLHGLEVNPIGITVFFTGRKGFRIVVDYSVFAIQPSANLHLQYKALARRLMKRLSIRTLDLSVYSHNNMLRMPNSKHPVTDLYQIPLTIEEIRTLDIEAIKALAIEPRNGIPCMPVAPSEPSERAIAFLEASLEDYSEVSNSQSEQNGPKQIVKKEAITSRNDSSTVTYGEWYSIGFGNFYHNNKEAALRAPCLDYYKRSNHESSSLFTLGNFWRNFLEPEELAEELARENEDCPEPVSAIEFKSTLKSINTGKYVLNCNSPLLRAHCPYTNREDCQLFDVMGFRMSRFILRTQEELEASYQYIVTGDFSCLNKMYSKVPSISQNPYRYYFVNSLWESLSSFEQCAVRATIRLHVKDLTPDYPYYGSDEAFHDFLLGQISALEDIRNQILKECGQDLDQGKIMTMLKEMLGVLPTATYLRGLNEYCRKLNRRRKRHYCYKRVSIVSDHDEDDDDDNTVSDWSYASSTWLYESTLTSINENEQILRIDHANALNCLKPLDLQIGELRKEGFRNWEIAEKIGKTPNYVADRLREIRPKLEYQLRIVEW